MFTWNRTPLTAVNTMAVAETDALAEAEKLVATTMRRKKGTENNRLKAAMATAKAKAKAAATGPRQTVSTTIN